MPDSENPEEHKPFGAIMKGSAEGAAALLLVESLIHALIKRSVLSVQEAINVIEVAAEVERELDATGLGPTLGDSRSVLAPMARTFRADLNG